MKPINHSNSDHLKLDSAVNRVLDLFDRKPEFDEQPKPNSASYTPQTRLSGNPACVFGNGASNPANQSSAEQRETDKPIAVTKLEELLDEYIRHPHVSISRFFHKAKASAAGSALESIIKEAKDKGETSVSLDTIATVIDFEDKGANQKHARGNLVKQLQGLQSTDNHCEFRG